MNGLAEIVLHYLRTILFYREGNVDEEFALHEWESLPDYLRALTLAERAALSNVAQRTLEVHAQPPDQYGYKPLITTEETNFLISIVSGELFEWDGGKGN